MKKNTTNSGYSYIESQHEFPQIDLVNPYQLKKGVEFELSKMDDLTGDAYQIALDRALKEMAKDKNKYMDLQIANFKEVKKADESLQMKQVGKKIKETVKTDASGHIKKPLKRDESANVSSKKENKKGDPKGVKQMTEKPKKAAGIKKTMDMPGKEQVLNELKSFLQKKSRLSEDMHYKYTKGQEVNTPEGLGQVTNIVGGTISVQLASGTEKDFQVNVLDKQVRDDFFSKMPNLGASFEKGKEKLTKEQVMTKLKEFFSKKKKKNEAVDIVTAETPEGDKETIATLRAGQGKRKADQLKSKGVTTATSQTLK